MSDRPMRLKYLTKMKIILCIFLLCITAVVGQSVELNGILGESVKFPAAVKNDGNLRYSGVTIGDVKSGRYLRARDNRINSRLEWEISTGLFSLSELTLEDSGVYTVQDTQQTSVSTFNLTVWVPVSKPNVSITRNEYPCTVECTAERGTGVILSWYREDEKKPFVTSPVTSAPYLHLPKTVERSGTYTCEAKNSVSNEKASITVGAHCAVNVSKPNVSITHNEYPCTIECTAKRGTGATLTLYRLGDKKRYSSSVSLDAPYLNMTVPVESGTYTCEAKNSVSSKTSDPLTVGAHCKVGFSTEEIVGIIFAVVFAILIAVSAVLFWRNVNAPPPPSYAKKLQDNVDPPASPKKLQDNVDPPASHDEDWTFIPDGNVNAPPPPAYGNVNAPPPPAYELHRLSERIDEPETEKGDPSQRTRAIL